MLSKRVIVIGVVILVGALALIVSMLLFTRKPAEIKPQPTGPDAPFIIEAAEHYLDTGSFGDYIYRGTSSGSIELMESDRPEIKQVIADMLFGARYVDSSAVGFNRYSTQSDGAGYFWVVTKDGKTQIWWAQPSIK